MSTIKITGVETVDALADRVAGVDARLLARTTNKAMDKERTAVRRAMAQASGAPYGRVVRVTRTKPASAGDLSYAINSEDEPTSLADYRPRETRKGVTAAPWRVRRTFGGSFMMGGRWQDRITLNLGGQVYVREGKARFPIVKLWGPILPREMVREGGEPLTAWGRGVRRLAEDFLIADMLQQLQGSLRR